MICYHSSGSTSFGFQMGVSKRFWSSSTSDNPTEHSREFFLQNYHNVHVVEFLRFGWPVSYMSEILPTLSSLNHPSAVAFSDHVEHYFQTELSYHAIAGPFSTNPLHQPLVCLPLQTVLKWGSIQRRVVMGLSFPPQSSVNGGIAASSYLNEPYKLRLPGIDHLCNFILQHGRGCLLYKKDLRRVYRQIPIDPKDYHLLGFSFNGSLYFDIRCPFGLRTSTMICQRTTSAVIYIFTQHIQQTFIWKISTARNAQTEHYPLFVIFRPYSIVWACKLRRKKTVHQLLP